MGKIRYKLLTPVHHIVKLVYMIRYCLRHDIKFLRKKPYLIMTFYVYPCGIIPLRYFLADMVKLLERLCHVPADKIHCCRLCNQYDYYYQPEIVYLLIKQCIRL